MNKNVFDNEETYKLYRNINEILHPSISKKNISDYKIIIDEEILPVRVFYPKKISELKRVIIYIRGNGTVTDCTGKYAEISKNIAKQLDTMMIAVDHDELDKQYEKMYQDIYETVKFIWKGLERNGIDSKDITLMGDSTGCNIISAINYLNNKELMITKEVFFYPTLSLEYFNNSKYASLQEDSPFDFDLKKKLQNYFLKIANENQLEDELLHSLKHTKEAPRTLILVGNVDPIKEEAKEYYENLPKENSNKYKEIPFCSHGFLKKMDKDIEQEVMLEVKTFIN